MATWADIQSWDHNAIIEAEDLIEAEVREAREIIADLEHAANDIRSQGEGPDRMRERLSEIQDKADHVATLVPGRTTNCRDSAGLNVGYAQNLRAAAAEQGKIDESKVATIAWMNYHAPQAGADGSVMFAGRAGAGADPLRNFMTGIHTWRAEQGLDVHQSGITHSYGSTTGGFAMRDIGEGVVDDFAYTGSPGAGVHSVESLGVDKEHVWVSGITHLDGVLGMGTDWNFGRDPRDLEGIGHLSGDATGARGYTSGEGDSYANHSMYFVAPEDDATQNYALNDLGAVIAGTKER